MHYGVPLSFISSQEELYNAYTTNEISTNYNNSMNVFGIAIGFVTFLVIGIFHPIVIKTEYHFGKKRWWIFLIAGLIFTLASIFVKNNYHSIILGVIAFSSYWSILEMFEQHERVRKGWFPMNPKRKDEYK